jgi:hypothetical protein
MPRKLSHKKREHIATMGNSLRQEKLSTGQSMKRKTKQSFPEFPSPLPIRSDDPWECLLYKPD